MKSRELTSCPMRGIRQMLKVVRLYYKAFPANERKPFRMILKKRSAGKSDIWYFSRNGRFAGFATTINGDGLILIDYLAVEKEMRGKGAGSDALQSLREKYAGRGVFVEIESVYEEYDDMDERLRRKRFYEKNGMKELRVLADVFGVRMELMGWDCGMTFEKYQVFYREHNSPWAAEHLKYVEFPR